MRDRITVDKELVPYTFDIVLGDQWFSMTIDYNEHGGFYTVALAQDDKVLCAGEKLVYGMPLFADVYRQGFPSLELVPLDESGETDIVNKATLENTVFLLIDDEGEQDG